MTSKRTGASQPAESQPPNLTIPRAEADMLLASRVDLGKELLSTRMANSQEFVAVQYKHKLWHEYNVELLRRIFDSEELSREYSFVGGLYFAETLRDKILQLNDEILDHIARLESIRERLPLYPEASQPSTSTRTVQTDLAGATTRKVFLVHGADQGMKEAVARFLTKLDLDPIVLHEQPNLGDTIIEKLERESPVAFSVVLLSCDDAAHPASDPSSLKPRARQNVVFELGFFIGRLGRDKVCALYVDGVELPSDFHGVVYIAYDPAGAWKLLLARELKASGLDIDLNKAI